MIRVTEHTRRHGKTRCHVCQEAIKPGQVYRALTMVGEDYMWQGFVLVTVHVCCIRDVDRDAWVVTDSAEDIARRQEQLTYILAHRREDIRSLRIGECVEAGGKPGTVTGAINGYVAVKLDGERHAKPYHPGDVVRSGVVAQGVDP